MHRAEVANKYAVSLRTTDRLIKSLRKAPIKPVVALSVSERKAAMVEKAFAAVEAGLDCPEDAYKRAGVGLSS